MDILDKWSASLLEWANPSLPQPGPTATWPLADFSVAVLVAAGYLVFVAVGTAVMTVMPDAPSRLLDRAVLRVQPFYNIVQVVLCSYMTLRAAEAAASRGFSLLCNDFDPTRTDIAFVVHVFYLSKALDFFDTVQIILRKSWRQLTFLHVFHHTSIFLVYALNVRAGYDGDVYFTVVLNAFVHTVMYLYYFMTPWFHAAKYVVWWKPLITYLQMAQFVAMNAQAIFALANGCPYPKNIVWLYLFYIIFLLALFANFAVRSYCSRGKKMAAPSASDARSKLKRG